MIGRSIPSFRISSGVRAIRLDKGVYTTALEGSRRPERPRILCVDDEPQILESLRDALRRHFDVRMATSGAEGLALTW